MGKTYRLLAQFSPDHKAASEAIFQTNGLLIKDKFPLITGFRKYCFRISIDSFKKETYEYIHKGATFKKLIDNLEFLVKCKSEGMDITTTLVMILMKSNFVDLEDIFEFAGTYKFDEVWVTPVNPAFGKHKILRNENIFHLPHLLEKIPGWQDILAKASEKATMTGNKLAYYHLEYIRSHLSTSVARNRYLSIRHLCRWELEKVQRPVATVLSSLRRRKYFF